MERIQFVFAIMVVILMLSNTLYLRSYLDFGFYDIKSIIFFIPLAISFILVNLSFSMMVKKIEKLQFSIRNREL